MQSIIVGREDQGLDASIITIAIITIFLYNISAIIAALSSNPNNHYAKESEVLL